MFNNKWCFVSSIVLENKNSEYCSSNMQKKLFNEINRDFNKIKTIEKETGVNHKGMNLQESEIVVHDRLLINGKHKDYCFETQTAINGWESNGTADNPYIINNYHIQGNGICIYNLWETENVSLWANYKSAEKSNKKILSDFSGFIYSSFIYKKVNKIHNLTIFIHY